MWPRRVAESATLCSKDRHSFLSWQISRTEKSYSLCSSLLGTSKKVMEYNLPRECIQKFFPSRTCFTFPFPTAPENVSHLERLDPAKLSSEFLEVTGRFCKFVFDKSDVKKLKDGYTVTGRGDSEGHLKSLHMCFQWNIYCSIILFDFFPSLKVLGHLAKTYTDTISSGAVPCLENAVIAMAMIENQAAVKEGLEVYQSGMEKLKNSFPLELKVVSSEHQRLSGMATQTFMTRSFRDSDGKHLKSLEVSWISLWGGALSLRIERCSFRVVNEIWTFSLIPSSHIHYIAKSIGSPPSNEHQYSVYHSVLTVLFQINKSDFVQIASPKSPKNWNTICMFFLGNS